MAKWVLDTSALIALKENEAGAGDVERILRREGRQKNVLVSFISLMEYEYLFIRTKGRSAAEEAYALLKQLPFQVVESEESLGRLAADIKSATSLSVADSWIAATALKGGATLVHKDPEFEPLKPRVMLYSLPYKNTKK